MFKVIYALITLILSSELMAKTLTCTVDQGEDSKGWIPDQFVLDLADDREIARVLNPKSEVFGDKDFEKGLFGSDFWARGSGRSKTGDTYNYQLQLILRDNDTRYKVTIKQQGYRDLSVKGRCSVGSRFSGSTSEQGRVASKIKATDQECAKVVGDGGDLVYAFLKLTIIDPQQGLRDLDSSPVLEFCINKARKEFPPIRQFINQRLYEKPLSASDCKAIDWEERFTVELTLSELDEKFRNESWIGSERKAVYDWCKTIFN